MTRPHAGLVTVLAIVVIVVVVIVVGWIVVHPAPDLVQGEAEATEIKIATKIPARVQRIHVAEGDRVGHGDVLVTLASPETEAKLAQAEAAREAATAQRDKADTGAREEEIRQAYNVWQRAKHAAELAETTAGRVERLYADGVLPEQRRDEAVARWKSAREAAEAARAVYDMARSGTREEDRRAAEALAAQAAGAVTEVEAYLAETRLESPIEGEVSVVVAEEGELAAAGFPLMTLLDLSDIWVSFNLREDRLGALRMGSRMWARIPALADREVEVKVSYIAAQGDYATWRATSASGGFDLRTFEVRARPLAPVEGLRPGMSAIVDWDRLVARSEQPASAGGS